MPKTANNCTVTTHGMATKLLSRSNCMAMLYPAPNCYSVAYDQLVENSKIVFVRFLSFESIAMKEANNGLVRKYWNDWLLEDCFTTKLAIASAPRTHVSTTYSVRLWLAFTAQWNFWNLDIHYWIQNRCLCLRYVQHDDKRVWRNSMEETEWRNKNGIIINKCSWLKDKHR